MGARELLAGIGVSFASERQKISRFRRFRGQAHDSVHVLVTRDYPTLFAMVAGGASRVEEEYGVAVAVRPEKDRYGDGAGNIFSPRAFG